MSSALSILLFLSNGCSPFLDDPAPYPPDPSLLDQNLVDSSLRLNSMMDRELDQSTEPTPPSSMVDQACLDGETLGGQESSSTSIQECNESSSEEDDN